MNNDDVSIGEWIITMIILMIPILNVIMILYWAFSSNTKASKSNYFKAILIMFLFAIALGIIVAMLGISLNASALNYFILK